MVAAAGGKGAALDTRPAPFWLTALVAMFSSAAGSRIGRGTRPSVMRTHSGATELASQTRRLVVGDRLPVTRRPGSQEYDRDALRWYDGHAGPAEAWRQMAGGNLPAIRFWHRTSLLPIDPLGDFGYISLVDPPPGAAGRYRTELDTEGRLLSRAAGDQRTLPPGARGPLGESIVVAANADWSRLFAAAGLSFGEFVPSAPRFVPPLVMRTAVCLGWPDAVPARRPRPC